MGKVKQTTMLNPAQIAVAKHMGVSLVDYVKMMQSASPTTMTTFNPNKDPAYSIPLSELANLWRARYGDLWVDVSEIEEEFWVDASARLHQNKMMEEINHRSDSTPWSRLKEDA
jgi:hypothetical protein